MHYFHGYISVYERDCDFKKQDSRCAVNNLKRFISDKNIRGGFTRHYYTMNVTNNYFNKNLTVIDHSIL